LADVSRDAIVSFDSERLILVDELDREIGHATKAACHEGEGMLHRAFSLFVFNPRGEVLLHQRAQNKRLWPGYWSNSCCSHPRQGEAMDDAVQRRLRQELGLACALDFVYKFRYRAAFGTLGAEHELCWVYAGVSDAPVLANANEVAAHRWVPPDELDREIAAAPARFTPWMRMEWRRLRDDFAHVLPRAVAGALPEPRR
jgi:isopentenyl-diphosphate delta-isomerase